MRNGRVDGADAWADANGVECLYFLASGDEPDAAHAAESDGFRLMDVRVELERDAGEADVPRGIREARAGDSELLRRIASASHGATRFYADPRFPDERCDELYETWIRRSLEGWADGVLVADDSRPLGYVTCHLHGDSGSIGLIAVDESARGRGLGVDLSCAAAAWCAGKGASRVTVVTQGRNVPALRTFQRAAFLVSSVDLWFHKWYAR